MKKLMLICLLMCMPMLSAVETNNEVALTAAKFAESAEVAAHAKAMAEIESLRKKIQHNNELWYAQRGATMSFKVNRLIDLSLSIFVISLIGKVMEPNRRVYDMFPNVAVATAAASNLLRAIGMATIEFYDEFQEYRNNNRLEERIGFLNDYLKELESSVSKPEEKKEL